MSKEKLYEVIAMELVPVSIKVMAHDEDEALEKVENGDWGDDWDREFNHSEIEDYFVKGLCEGYEEDDDGEDEEDDDWEDEEDDPETI